MKRPTWALVIGIIGIVFSCFGIINAFYSMFMPFLFKMQTQLYQNMPNGDSAANMLRTMYKFPDWFQGFSIFIGILGALVAGYYLFASIQLLNTKRNAIILYYLAIALNIFFALIKCAGLVAGGSMMMVMMIFAPIFGIIINVALVIIVAVSDKTAFKAPPANLYQSGTPSI